MLQDNIEYMTNYIFKNKDSFAKNIIGSAEVIIREVSFLNRGVEIFYQDEHRLMTDCYPWERLNNWLYKVERNVINGDCKDFKRKITEKTIKDLRG